MRKNPPVDAQLKKLTARVSQYIAAPVLDSFEPIAIDIFRYQSIAISAYSNYCRQIDVNPESVDTLDRIPLVSTAAFKYARLCPVGARETPGARVFLTSGTSIGAGHRGCHVISHPEIYRASAIAHLRSMLFPDDARVAMLAIHPTADRMMESSLSAMMTWCIEAFGNGHSLCAASRDGIDFAATHDFLNTAARAGEPVCMLGTTAAFAALFDYLRRAGARITLAAGSRAMDTGGPKGQRTPLSSADVVESAFELLGINPELMLNEYGMTELCSQLYDATSFNSCQSQAPGDRVKIAPAWMRPMAVDPATMLRVSDGEPGMLAFIDLANVCSVSAIVTEDLGVVTGRQVRVFGRAETAEARGCALAIEAFRAVER